MGHIIPWITVALNGALTGIVAWLVKKATVAFDEQKKERKELEEQQRVENRMMRSAMLAMLRDRLFAGCIQALDRHEITVEDRENIDSLYEQYHALGGNHIGDTLYQRVEALKLVDKYGG